MTRKLLYGFAAFSVMTLVVAAPASAKQSLKGQGLYYLGPDQTVAGDLITAAGTVEIRGKVDGDVIVAGGNITVAGEVNGDVIAAGGNIDIDGLVTGNVRAVGGNIRVNGYVGQNVSTASGTLRIGEQAEVGRGILAGAGLMEIRGKVGRDVRAGVGQLLISGQVGGKVAIQADRDSELILLPGAKVAGDFSYRASKDILQVRDGASIEGRKLFEQRVYQRGRTAAGWFIAWWLISLISLLIVGALVQRFASRWLGDTSEVMRGSPWPSLGRGLAVLVGVPVAAILLLFTVVGVPLAVIGFGAYLLAIYLSSLLIGAALMSWYQAQPKAMPVAKGLPPFAALAIGVAFWRLVVVIPFIGWFIALVGIGWALGAMWSVGRESVKRGA